MKLELDRETAAELEDIPDEVLMAQVAAELPRYLRARLVARLPAIAVAVVALTVVASRGGDEPAPAASEQAIPSVPAVTAPPVAPAAVPSVRVPAANSAPVSPFVPPATASPTPAASTSATTVPATRPDDDDAAAGLVIAESGYASATGGTPLEQEPVNGGLPVQATFGQHVRRSFLRLDGDDTLLHLRLDEAAANSGADTASIDACPITASDWTAERAQPLGLGPTFDTSACVAGQRLPDGSWTFELSGVEGGPTRPEGIALVPGAGNVSTFDLVFSPLVVE